MTAPPFQSATIPRERLLPGIHGLRGLAALAVVLYHLALLAKITVPDAFWFIPRDFGYGVHLFFVLSAFSLMYSTEYTMQRPTWVKEYFVKRFWRIAPLYYFMMVGMIFVYVVESREIYDVATIMMNLTFTFNFAPWTGIVLGGWAIGVEMIFYAILPVLLFEIRTRFATFILLVVSILASYAIRSTLHVHFASTVSQYGWNWAYFSFGSNLCFFVMGIYAFRLNQHIDQSSVMGRWGVPLFSTILLALLMLTELDRPLKGIGRIDLILWGLGFAALCVWQSIWPSRWIASRFLEYVGERSYSVYLLHPMLIILLKRPLRHAYEMFAIYVGTYAFFVCGVLIIVLLLAASEITYRLIEIPGIRFGRWINRKRELQLGLLQA